MQLLRHVLIMMTLSSQRIELLNWNCKLSHLAAVDDRILKQNLWFPPFCLQFLFFFSPFFFSDSNARSPHAWIQALSSFTEDVIVRSIALSCLFFSLSQLSPHKYANVPHMGHKSASESWGSCMDAGRKTFNGVMRLFHHCHIQGDKTLGQFKFLPSPSI